MQRSEKSTKSEDSPRIEIGSHNVDQVGGDQAKVLSNISTQALSLLILLGIISGMIANLFT